MTRGTGVLEVRVERTSRRRRVERHQARGREPSNFTRTMGEPTGARTDASPTSLLFSWDPKPGAKQYRVLVANREDFATTVEDVRTDSISLAPTLTSTWWKVAAYDEDNNVGDFTHSFGLQRRAAREAFAYQRLRIFVRAGSAPLE